MYQKLSKSAYTLTELLIAVAISAMVLIIIFFFITDTLIQLADTEKNSRFLTDFSRFSSQFQEYSSTFSSSSILINNTSTGWFDAILLERDASSDSILWAVVDMDLLKAIPNTEFWKYKNAVMGYRVLSPAETVSLKATPTNLYSLDFFWDKIFEGFKVKNLQASFFNAGSILSMNMEVVRLFEIEKLNTLWQTQDRSGIFDVILNY